MIFVPLHDVRGLKLMYLSFNLVNLFLRKNISCTIKSRVNIKYFSLVMIDYIVCVGSFYNVTVYCDKWGCKMYRQTERLRTQHSSTKTLKKMGCHCSKRGLLISLMVLDITTSVLALVLMLYGESLTNLFPLVITFIVPTLELPGKLMTSHK